MLSLRCGTIRRHALIWALASASLANYFPFRSKFETWIPTSAGRAAAVADNWM
jgi:hypothetical protein